MLGRLLDFILRRTTASNLYRAHLRHRRVRTIIVERGHEHIIGDGAWLVRR